MAITKSGITFTITSLVFLTFLASRSYYLSLNTKSLKQALSDQEQAFSATHSNEENSHFEKLKTIEELYETEKLTKLGIAKKLDKCTRETEKKIQVCEEERANSILKMKDQSGKNLAVCQQKLNEVEKKFSQLNAEEFNYSSKEVKLEEAITNLKSELALCQTNEELLPNPEINKLRSQLEKLTNAKNEADKEFNNLNENFIKANAVISNLKADLGAQPKLSDKLNNEKDFKAKEKQILSEHNLDLEKLTKDYDSRLHNMKNHYENQLNIAKDKIKELLEMRQSKIENLHTKMNELKVHLDKYSSELSNSSFNSDMGIEFEEFRE